MGFKELINKFSTTLLGTKDILGVDIGTDSIKIIQLKHSAKKWHLINWDFHELPKDESLQDPLTRRATVATLLQTFVKEKKPSTTYAFTSVAGTSVVVRYVKFPKMSPSDLRAALRFEAEPYIPLNLDEVYLDFHILGESGTGKEKVMDTVLVAVKKDLVNEKIETLKQGNLYPVGIDIDAFALESIYEISTPSKVEVVIFVNCGATSTNISIIEDGVSKVVRDINMGVENISNSLKVNMGIPPEGIERIKQEVDVSVFTQPEKLSQISDHQTQQVYEILSSELRELLFDVQRSIDYYASQSERDINRVLISGGLSGFKGIDKFIASELHFPCETFNPFQSIDIPKNFKVRCPGQFAIACGLATRAWGDKKIG